MKLLVSGIQFSYNSHQVLKDVSFQLSGGMMLGVLGVNGAGKSTLLKCLNKVLSPQNGSVLLDGEDILSMKGSEIAKRVAYMPQKYSDEPLTVFDAVLLGRKPHIRWTAGKNDYTIVEDILKKMNLESFALRQVRSLSGGEMQKVIIARALAQEPKVLLLDEPTSNLDIRNQFDVMATIRRIVKDRKLSAIVSIHDLNLALRFSDWVLMMKDHQVYRFVPKQAVTSDMIKDVYHIDVCIMKIDGHPIVAPVYHE